MTIAAPRSKTRGRVSRVTRPDQILFHCRKPSQKDLLFLPFVQHIGHAGRNGLPIQIHVGLAAMPVCHRTGGSAAVRRTGALVERLRSSGRYTL